jgi:hypothetical protein
VAEDSLEHAGKILSPPIFFEGVKLSVIRKMRDLRMQFMAEGKNLTDDQWAAITAHMMRAATEASFSHLKLAIMHGIDMREIIVLTEDDLAKWITDTGSGELQKVPYGSN